jgi:broad specificity phosphatase PhoE
VDVPNHLAELTETGVYQAKTSSNFFANKKTHKVVYCSHFYRTQQTASLVLPNLPQIIDSRLGELWRGVWYSLTLKELEEKHPEEISRRKYEGDYFYKALNGESCPEAETRIHSFLDSFILGPETHRVVCGHGNWMLLLDRILTNGTPESYLAARREEPVRNCEIFTYQFNGKEVKRIRTGVRY